MTNLEKYNNAFTESFEITEDQLAGLKYQDIEAWDSVGHMGLIAALEDAFDIMMDTDDIIDFSICNHKYILEDLKNVKAARFVKRYASEEELDIDVTLRYGDQCKLKNLDAIKI